jgi:16S rRNA processing protein RimM
MTNQTDRIVVGRLGAVHGIKGWIKVNSFTDNAADIFGYQPLEINFKGKWQQVKFVEWRTQGTVFVAKLDVIGSREQAQAWVNCDIAIKADQLKDLPEDEFYWKDLIGCEVVNTKGYNMGTVTGILETGSNDVLQVKANSKDAFGKKERLIPFVTEQFVINIDTAKQQITVDWDPDF